MVVELAAGHREGLHSTGQVRAYDVIRMIQREGNPTPLGHAIAHYGRPFKSLHVLTYVSIYAPSVSAYIKDCP
jgi:hypothetical protein